MQKGELQKMPVGTKCNVWLSPLRGRRSTLTSGDKMQSVKKYNLLIAWLKKSERDDKKILDADLSDDWMFIKM